MKKKKYLNDIQMWQSAIRKRSGVNWRTYLFGQKYNSLNQMLFLFSYIDFMYQIK